MIARLLISVIVLSSAAIRPRARTIPPRPARELEFREKRASEPVTGPSCDDSPTRPWVLCAPWRCYLARVSDKPQQTYILHTVAIAIVIVVVLVLFLKKQWG